MLEHFADFHSGVVVFLIIGVRNFSKRDGNKLVSNQLKLLKTKQNSRFSSSGTQDVSVAALRLLLILYVRRMVPKKALSGMS